MAKAELTGADKERARANLAYWEKREKAQAAAYQLEEDELARRVQARYNYLLTEIDARINDFYQRFAKAEGITMNLAEMAVSKMDVQAYNARAAQLVKDRDFSPKANQELRLYNATMRINRLEMLKSRIGLELVDTYQQLEDDFGEAFRTRCTEEYERQAGILGQSTNVMPQKDIERILTADFNNANWSSRLWANQGALRDRISELLTNGIIQGRSVRVMAKDLQELLIDPSASNALRLLRTEMNRVQTETQMASFRDNGYKQYMFISTEDSRTCSQCSHLNGEIFDVDDPEAFKPPQHPNCRCSTAAYMDRAEVEKELFGEKEVERAENFGIINGERKMANGPRRSPYIIISQEEEAVLRKEADEIEIPQKVLSFNTGYRTSFDDEKKIIHVRGDVFPSEYAENANSIIPSRAALAHEYYGHMANDPSNFEPGDWRDEFQASYFAAINTPNLSDNERRLLMLDAFERASKAGVKLKYNPKAKEIIYGA